jgi:hypothetical protein
MDCFVDDTDNLSTVNSSIIQYKKAKNMQSLNYCQYRLADS